MISGDIILGSPSAVVNDLDIYLKNLKMLQKMNFDFILLPHSVGMETNQIIVDAKTKLHEYITYRETRLNELLRCFYGNKTISREAIYQTMYGGRGLNQVLTLAAYHNLDLQITKLCKDNKIKEVSKHSYISIIPKL